MIASHGFRIAFGRLLRDFLVFCQRICEIVSVNEIMSGIVWRIDVDHLDLTVIGGLKEFENFEVVPFQIKVLRGIEVDAFLATWPKRGGTAFLCKFETVGFPFPAELVFFEIVCGIISAKRQQFFQIQFAFGETFGEYRRQPAPVLRFQIHGKSIHYIIAHIEFIPDLTVSSK